MTQPVWQTPAGNLGTIPENRYFVLSLSASITAESVTANCTTTNGNLISCDDTSSAKVGYTVTFAGTTFGGIEEGVTYYVHSVPSSTSFSISSDPNNNTPVDLSTASGVMTATFRKRIYYKLQAGNLPQGLQVSETGNVAGIPTATIQGIPSEVAQDVSSKFTVRAYTVVDYTSTVDRFIDRTFTLTVTGQDLPEWVTPAGNIGTYYDSEYVDIQLEYTDTDPGELVYVQLASGQLPLGLSLSDTGRIQGYIRPVPNEDQLVGYDLQPYMTAPYDFLVSAISKNFEFTLLLSDGHTSNLRTFSIYVQNRSELTSDTTELTADATDISVDNTTDRMPFLVNFEPSNIGVFRSENNFAYRFIGDDYDNTPVEYSISVDQGYDLPPGLVLDPYTGWYYGYIPALDTTQTTYSFFITVRSRSIAISNSSSVNNAFTCDSTVRSDFRVGSPVTFDGTTIGGIVANQTYYVDTIIDDYQFTISETDGGATLALTTDSVSDDEYLFCVPLELVQSDPYPFTLTITGVVDRDVEWVSPSDLGSINTGDISSLSIEAYNVAGTPLYYQLAEGYYNRLPEGLQLQSTGEITGRVSFKVFSIDGGATTIDADTSTTFDSVYTFNVNAYAEDNQQALYKLSNIKVINGGSGYSTAPTITFSQPSGATAVQATATFTLTGDQVTNATITEEGADYLEPATYTITGGGGSGLEIEITMQLTGYRRVITDIKEFQVTVTAETIKPYQNLYIEAMPSVYNRQLLDELLSNDSIFVPAYLYRNTDPNFGVSSKVNYLHAVGLAPEIIDTYVESLELNHYWKNLVLGEIKTARALDANGEVIYEVVYSEIQDNLVNNEGQSISKGVSLPYPAIDPADSNNTINSVFPNSLDNMRNQVIDVVGQLSQSLPLWMTSKQSNGQILGFTPAWVICYTKPNRSKQIAYYLDETFGQQLNQIDFKVDRYVLDNLLTKDWDTETQSWTPTPSQTVFDRLNTITYNNLGNVNVSTTLAFSQINGATISAINDLGGLDGFTWVYQEGEEPPAGTKVTITNGSLLVFAKQEDFQDLSINEAFTNNVFSYGSYVSGPGYSNWSQVLRSSTVVECSSASAATDLITCDSTLGLKINDKVVFTGTVFSNIDSTNSSGEVQTYYVQSVDYLEGSATTTVTNVITVDDLSKIAVNDEIWFEPWVGILVESTEVTTNKVFIADVSGLIADQQIVLDDAIGGLSASVTYYIQGINTSDNSITVSATPGGGVVALTTDSNSVSAVIGGPLGGIDGLDSNGLAKPYYILSKSADTGSGTITISETVGGSELALSLQTGMMKIYVPAFSVALTANALTPYALDSDLGTMLAEFGNDRMGIWSISISESDEITLTLVTQTVYKDYITTTQGDFYPELSVLYHTPRSTTTSVKEKWRFLSMAEGTVGNETTFDQNSVRWLDPIDIPSTTNEYDKYLIFPKQNILE